MIDRGCGLDVHKDTVVASVKGKDIEAETRTFSTFRSLHELVGWLQNHGITHVARPLQKIFELMLVNARHIKNVPGHKTDKKDSLLLSGLLKGSFVPDQSIRELRFLPTAGLIRCGLLRRTDYKNILEDANIKLASVVNVFGVSRPCCKPDGQRP